jgi:hypothetical protein
VARISPGEIEGGDSDKPLFVVGDELAPVMVSPRRRFSLRARLRGKEVVVDYRHPHLVELLDHYEALPALAVGCLAKALCLHDLAPEADDGVIFQTAREIVAGGVNR